MFMYNCLIYVLHTSTLFTGSYTMNILEETCSEPEPGAVPLSCRLVLPEVTRHGVLLSPPQ
jgi:hypothetical protein